MFPWVSFRCWLWATNSDGRGENPYPTSGLSVNRTESRQVHGAASFLLLGIMLRPRGFRELVFDPRCPVGDHGDLLTVRIGAGVDDEVLSVRRNIVGISLVREGLHFARE